MKLLPLWGFVSVRCKLPFPELICCLRSCISWWSSHSRDPTVEVQRLAFLLMTLCAISFSFSIFLNSWWLSMDRYIMEMFWKIHSLATRSGKQCQQGLLQNLMKRGEIGRAHSGSYQSDLKWLQVKYTTSWKICEWLKYMQKVWWNLSPVFVS